MKVRPQDSRKMEQSVLIGILTRLVDKYNGVRLFKKAIASVTIPQRMGIIEWIGKHRHLRFGASTGPYDPNYFPPINDILTAITGMEYLKVVLKAGVQSGKTEAMMSCLLWAMDQQPCDIAWVVPRDKDCPAFFKERIKPSIKFTPVLQGRYSFPSRTGRGYSGGRINHNGGWNLRIKAAGSAMELSSFAARLMFADEVDKYPESVGEGNADPITLLEGRAKNYFDSVLVMACSPTIGFDEETGTGSRIEAAYLDSSQQRWHCPCPKCEVYEHWTFTDNVKWDTEDIGSAGFRRVKILPKTARLECSKCGHRFTEKERMESMRSGRWVADNPQADEVAGFHWSRLIFPLSTMENIVTEYSNALGHPTRMATFYNDCLAETYQETGDRSLYPEAESIDGQYAKLSLNPDIVYMVAGVDVQGNRLEVVRIGVGKTGRLYVLDYRQIHGDTAKDEVWGELTLFLKEVIHRPEGVPLFVHAVGIDTGWMTTKVLEYIALRRWGSAVGAKVFPLKGGGDPFGTRPFIPVKRPKTLNGKAIIITDKSTGQRKMAKIETWVIGSSQGKTELNGRMVGGDVTFCNQLPNDYFNQLGNEQFKPVDEKKSKWLWVHTKGRNDALDATLYGYCAHRLLAHTIASYAKEGIPRVINRIKLQFGQSRKTS